MTPLPDRFIEDRALRDAARAVLTEDLARLRGSLSEQGIASRVSSSVSTTITGRMKAGARDVLAQARAQASDHKGVLALLIGAIILFFARGPILDWLEDSEEADDIEDAAPEPAPESALEGDLA
ncbi:MAG: hypothetical protein C0471_05850 [Erythrobacter sp.]|nr:hypothetical protein [Erythrobacter sp.]